MLLGNQLLNLLLPTVFLCDHGDQQFLHTGSTYVCLK